MVLLKASRVRKKQVAILQKPPNGCDSLLVRFCTGNQVAQGPFKELSLGLLSPHASIRNKNCTMFSTIGSTPKNLVCVAAEGYYAVGMAIGVIQL